MSEVPVFSGVGAAMRYDNNAWTPLDAGSSGIFLYHNASTNAYRVIGVDSGSQQFNLNSSLTAASVSSLAAATFVTWRDDAFANGVNFGAAETASQFADQLAAAIANLSAGALPPPPTTPPSSTGTVASSVVSAGGGGTIGRGNAETPPPRPASKAPSRGSTLDRKAGGSGTSTLDRKTATDVLTAAATLSAASFPTARCKLILNLFQTEGMYGRMLDQLVQARARLESIINAADMELIFGWLKPLQSQNQRLVYELSVRVGENYTEKTKVAELYVETFSNRAAYKTYLVNLEEALARLPVLEKKKKEFASQLVFFQKNIFNGTDLKSVLASPQKHYEKLVALWTQIKEKTGADHPDFADTEKVNALAQDFAMDVKQTLWEHSNSKKTATLRASKKTMAGLESFLAEGKRIVYDDDHVTAVLPIGKTVTTVVVLEDLLAFVTAEKKKTVEWTLPLLQVWVGDKPSQTAVKILNPVGDFDIICSSPESRTDLFHQITIALEFQLRARALTLQDRQLKLELNDGRKMEGTFSDGRLHGTGECRWPNGSVFVGSWAKGLPSGEGTMTWIGGEKMTGSFSDGRPHGRCTLETAEGKMVSDFSNGLRHGQTEITYNDLSPGAASTPAAAAAAPAATAQTGANSLTSLFPSAGRVTGTSSNNVFEGVGISMAVSTFVFVGAMISDKFHGQGHLTTYAGEYVGNFSGDFRDGIGKMTYHDGSVYEGSWAEDQRNGQGVWTSPDKKIVYTGLWASGMRAGQGEEDCLNVYKKKGTWRADLLHGPAEYHDLIDLSVYVGNFSNGKFEGKGKITYSDSSFYEGSFEGGFYHGKGIEKNADGSSYEGDWERGKRNGKGTQTYVGGEVYKGDWKADFRNGDGVYTAGEGGVRYEGSWYMNRRHGKGVLLDRAGKYVGLFKNDVPHGHGTYTDTRTGAVCAGVWQDGHRHGEAQITLTNGTSRTVKYSLGSLTVASKPEGLDLLFELPPQPRVIMKE